MVFDFRPFDGTGAGRFARDLSELDFFRMRREAMSAAAKNELNPEAFDRMVGAGKPSKIIWTLPAIGRRIGVGSDFVRDVIAKADGSPVRALGGKFYCFEDELIAFLRADRGKPS